ncbi:hypothetical protein Tco_1498542 [Tanacetum coccineum]
MYNSQQTVSQSFTPYWNFSMIDDEEARENFMKDICTFLRKFSRIPFGVTPKDIQELMSKLLEELSEYINYPSWNRPIFYDNEDDEYTIIYRKHAKITPDLPIKEPDNSLIIGDEYLDTIHSVEELIIVNSNDDDTSSDNDDFEDIEYVEESPPDLEIVSLEEVNDVDQENEEFDLENIL